jgi:hypothetical protein
MGYSHIFPVTKTIVTDTNAYSVGDFVGTAVLTLENASQVDGGILETITLTDKAKQSLAIDFLFFATACANSTFTNNGALTIHATDILQYLGHVSIVAGDYTALVDNSAATKRDIRLAFSSGSSSVYCVPVARGTPTYTASALQATFVFNRL